MHYYSLLAEGCESFQDLERFHGKVRLVLNNFGRCHFEKQKIHTDTCSNVFYLSFVSASAAAAVEADAPSFALQFTENVRIQLTNEPKRHDSIGNLDSSFQVQVAEVSSVLRPDQVLLPSCLVCLSRLDKTVSGLTPLSCRDLYHFCCQAQCRLLSVDCPVCTSIISTLHGNNNVSSVSCGDCGSRDDLWICLLCGNLGCGRYRGGHAHDHFTRTRHVFALNVSSHHIWDYLDDRYVHRTIRCAQGTVAIDDEVGCSEVVVDSAAEDSFSAELCSAQLESQKAFFDGRLREQEAHYSRLLVAQDAEFKEESQRLKAEIELLQKERNIFSELKKQLQIRLQKHKSETDAFRKELEAEKLISAGLVRRNEELQQQLTAAQTELKELDEQVRDLMKHFETLDLVAQTDNDPDIVNGKIIIKPSSAAATARKAKQKQK